MSGGIDGPLNNQQVPFSYIQNNGQDYVQRPLRAFEPVADNDNGGSCGSFFACIRDAFLGLWDCIVNVFLACCTRFGSPEEDSDLDEIGVNPPREPVVNEVVLPKPEVADTGGRKVHPVEPGPIQKKEAPTTLLTCQDEVLAYALSWDAQRFGQDKLPKRTPNTSVEGLKKYLAFIELGRFEYSEYPSSYRAYYFAVIRRDVRLLTIELRKLEQAFISSSEPDERSGILARMSEALKEIAIAGATGCDPQKSTVTFQQWKHISQRVDVFEIILEHIQNAKFAIFAKRVKGVEVVVVNKGSVKEKQFRVRNDIDSSIWAAHCRNWIYANFGKEYGLCNEERVHTAQKDGYIEAEDVTNLAQELILLQATGKMRETFRQEFTKEYLEEALLNAMNGDEYPKPYTDALQTYCKEIQADYKHWDNYRQTMLSPGGTSFMFTPRAVAFFLSQKNENNRSLEIDWANDEHFWNFVQTRIPEGFDGIDQQELAAVNPAHLLRIWNTYFAKGS